MYVVTQELKDKFYSKSFFEVIKSASAEKRAVLSNLDTILSPFAGGATLEDAAQAIAHRLSIPVDTVENALHLLLGLGFLVNKGPIYDRPIFIVSAPRAGSTLLFETLVASEHLWSIGRESHDIFEGIPDLHPFHCNYNSNQLEAVDASLPIVKQLKERFTRMLQKADGTRFFYDNSGGPSNGVRFLEKTPKNALRIPFIKAVFPDARFIYLSRDAGPNISSTMEGLAIRPFYHLS